MAREKMHKEMVPPGGFFMRRSDDLAGIVENPAENLWKVLEEAGRRAVKSTKNRRKKLAAVTWERGEKPLADFGGM